MKSNLIAKCLARIGRVSAIKSSGTASGFGTYQPKEPVILKSANIKNTNK